MRKDGVNVNDYFKYSGLFYQCPICSVKSQTLKSLASASKLKKSVGNYNNKINCYNKVLGGIKKGRKWQKIRQFSKDYWFFK
jgi:hypothetical protein